MPGGDDFALHRSDGLSRTSLPTPTATPKSAVASASDSEKRHRAISLISSVRDAIIGDDQALPSAFGPRKSTYVDSTASGRACRLIEDVILGQVLPVYANTHTTTSYTGFSSQHFLDESRALVRDWCRVNDRESVVLFTGRGSTEASNRLVHYLLGPAQPQTGDSDLSCPYPGCGRHFSSRTDVSLHGRQHSDGEASVLHALAQMEKEQGAGAKAGQQEAHGGHAVQARGNTDRSVTVLVGPRAHHSSFLPYRHAGATLLHLPEPSMEEAQSGLGISLPALLQAMAQHHTQPGAARRALIVVLTFASNVTGECYSEEGAARVCAAVHAMGGVVAWDCAASAPHQPPVVDPHISHTWAGILGGSAAEGAWKSDPTLSALLTECMSISAALHSARPQLQQFGWSGHKDAAFFSMHKLVGGGAGSPGVLILRRALLDGTQWTTHSSGTSARAFCLPAASQTGPYLPGGGTVFFVDHRGQPTYLGQDAEREEGGTPDTVSCARAGLMVHLFRSVGAQFIAHREGAMAQAARAAWASHPCIRVYGQGSATDGSPRMPIVSVSILASPSQAGAHSPTAALQLHHGLVCAMLNDIFGIQARGGCLCAGVYSQSLLGMASSSLGVRSCSEVACTHRQDTPSDKLLSCLVERDELLRPGFVRLGFVYHMSVAEFEHVVRSVAWIAEHGVELLAAGLYSAVAETGEWRMHRAKASTLLSAAYRQVEAGARQPRELIGRYCPSFNSVGHGLSHHQHSSPAESLASAATELQEASRGGAKAPSRPWLQAVRFGDFVQEETPSASAEGLAGATASPAAPAASAAPWHQAVLTKLMPVTAKSTAELAELFAAYREEADMMSAALRAARPSSTAVSEGQGQWGGGVVPSTPSSGTPLLVPTWGGNEGVHLHATGLLSPAGQALRWFVLPEDLQPSQQAGAACKVELTADARRCVGPTAMFPYPARTLQAGDAAAGAAADATVATLHAVARHGLVAVLQGRVAGLDYSCIVTLEGEDKVGDLQTLVGQAHSMQRGEAAGVADGHKSTPSSRATPTHAPNQAGGTAAPSAAEGVRVFVPPPPPKMGPAPTARGGAVALAQPVFSLENARALRKASPLASAAAPAQPAFIQTPASPSVAHIVSTSASSGKGAMKHKQQDKEGVKLPLPSQAEQKALGPLEYVWRRARLAKVQEALSVVPRPSASVSRAIASGLKRAITQFDMIRHGDRILVGLSGGKDSMTLLLELLRLQAIAPVWFEVGACTVDPQYEGAYDPAPLAAWCAALQVEYTIESMPVLELAGEKMTKDSLCAFCSRMKRGILYGACRRRGYNVLALGQHADDFAESFVMSAFQNGLLRTMKAHYTNEANDVRIIRPLCYVRELDTRAYAFAAQLPVIPENCPGCFTAPQVRYATKKLLAREEAKNASLFSCLLQAIQPLMTTAGALSVRSAVLAAPPASGSTGTGLVGTEGEEGQGQMGADDGEDDALPAPRVGKLAIGQTVEEETMGVAPAGFVPASLAPPVGEDAQATLGVAKELRTGPGGHGAGSTDFMGRRQGGRQEGAEHSKEPAPEDEMLQQHDMTAAVFSVFSGGEDDFA